MRAGAVILNGPPSEERKTGAGAVIRNEPPSEERVRKDMGPGAVDPERTTHWRRKNNWGRWR